MARESRLARAGATDIATCMWYTGLEPFTKQDAHVARGLKDREMQRALMQFFKPENYFEVREALIQAGRKDLIGDDCDSLIPAQPPREALDRRRKDANSRFRGEYVHTIGGKSEKKEIKNKIRSKSRNQKEGRYAGRKGYRPNRKGTQS